MAEITRARSDLIDPAIALHHGRVVKSTGKMSERVAKDLCFVAAAMLSIIALPASAQNDEVQRDLKAVPGKTTRIGIYINVKPDCTSGPLPEIRLVTPPAHGVVRDKRANIKLTNFKQCPATQLATAPSRAARRRAHNLRLDHSDMD